MSRLAPSRLLLVLIAGAFLAMTVRPSHADESAILDRLGAFFAADTTVPDEAAIALVTRDPAWDPAKLESLLHRLDLYSDLGRKETFEVAVGSGHARRLTLRVPKDYDPRKPWPVIYALHASGGTGPGAISRLKSQLGSEIDRFVVAAPTHYRQTSLDAPPPFTADHPAMLRELRRRVHVDPDRLYALGYSLGGYTSWAIAVLHPDQVAAAVPMASCFVPEDVEGLWEEITPNFQHLPILHVWGSRDHLRAPGFEGRFQGIGGTMAKINERFSPFAAKHCPTVVDHRIEGAGHGGANPPKKLLLDTLAHERVGYPDVVHHRFRHLHQASAYWLEGHEWEGDHWGARVKVPSRREPYPKTLGSVILPLLGHLDGKVDGQTLDVRTKHLSDLTVWIGPDMIDWTKPVRIVHNGVKIFEGELARDLGVALAQAKRTRDFGRLRWAGVRITKGKAKVVTPDMVFPSLLGD